MNFEERLSSILANDLATQLMGPLLQIQQIKAVPVQYLTSAYDLYKSSDNYFHKSANTSTQSQLSTVHVK